MKNKKLIVGIFGIVVSLILMITGVYLSRSNQHENQMPQRQQNEIRQNVGKPQQFDDRDFSKKPDDQMNTEKISALPIIFIGGGSVLCAMSVMYLWMSKGGKNRFFENKDKVIIYVLSSVLLTELLAGGALLGTGFMKTNQLVMPFDEEVEKEEIDTFDGIVVDSTTIDLNDYNENILIQKGGTYILSGTLKNSVIVNVKDEEVILQLNGVTNESQNTAAIVGTNQKKLTIDLLEGTINTLTDNGSSEYDACLYSASDLEIKGNGTLIVNGQQEEGEGIATEDANITIHSGNIQVTSKDDGLNAGGDNGGTITINGGTLYIDASGEGIDSNKDAVINGGTVFVMGSDQGGNAGIDTDDGYVINGGTVIALGTDMIEKPENTSQQKSICLTLNETINKNTNMTLVCDNKEVISFQSSKVFRTIIISTSNLTTDEYRLYTNTTHTGELVNGIYQGGEYSGGSLLNI